MVIAFVLASALGALLYLVLTNGQSVTGVFAHGEWVTIIFQTLRAYLPLHAIFFFGSVYFRKHALGHTLLAIVAWAASYAIIAVTTVRIVFNPYFSGVRRVSDSTIFSFESRIEEIFSEGFTSSIDSWAVIFEVAFVLLFWVLAWVRLRETEA
jgi:hypothetical protein